MPPDPNRLTDAEYDVLCEAVALLDCALDDANRTIRRQTWPGRGPRSKPWAPPVTDNHRTGELVTDRDPYLTGGGTRRPLCAKQMVVELTAYTKGDR